MKNDTASQIRSSVPTEKIRPCDCKDQHTTDKLMITGFSTNNNGISVGYGKVTLKFTSGEITYSVHQFKKFAEWFLEEQKPIS